MAKSSMTPKAAARIQSSAAKSPASGSNTSGFYQRTQSAGAKNLAVRRPVKSSGGK